MTATDSDTSPAAGLSPATKVPVVTLSFWVLKVLTTGLGEAASDSLVRAAGLVAVEATALVLIASLVVQFRVDRHIPWLYWTAVLMVAVFGTMAADIPHRLGVPLWVTSSAYLLAVLSVFWWWHRLEGTLSFVAITTRRRESFYWAAVLATFALGTAVGDLTARSWHLGYLTSGVMFAVLITLPREIRRWRSLSAVTAFWIAYVLTRPLGASFADWMGASPRRGGLGWGMPITTAVWALAFALAVACFATATRRKNAAISVAPG